MTRPSLKPLPHLRQVLKAVIHSCDPSEAPAFMIKDALHNMWRNAKPTHMRRRRPSQIMQCPCLDTWQLVCLRL